MHTNQIKCYGHDNICIWITQLVNTSACLLEAQQLKLENPHWKVWVTWSDGREEEVL